jgi:flagellar hook-basal body complex protein FliE
MMKIEGLSGLSETPALDKARGQGFGDMLNQGIEELSQLQNKSTELTQRLAAGENVELHDVMIAGQEADVALRMATQLRTLALDAYREVLRMPV